VLRTIGLFDRVATVRDDRQSPFVLDLLTRCLTVVGLVGGHDERRSRRIQDFFDDLAVVDLSTSDGEVQWSTLAIDDRMDFRGPPPLAARCAFTIVLSIKYKLSRDFAASASKIRFQTPRRDQRLNRLYALV
jgi:hypothetical protein